MLRDKTAWKGLAALAALVSLASATAGGFTDLGVRDWYPALNKPAWAPAADVFGPASMGFYALMTLAAWRVWKSVGWAHRALGLFLLQLVLSVAWPGLFFALRRTGWALLVLLLLCPAATAAGLAFRRVERTAGFLFLPYVLWLLVLTVLNLAVWRLN